MEDVAIFECDRSSSLKSSFSSHNSARSSTNNFCSDSSEPISKNEQSGCYPEFPYVFGFTTTATRHEPPEPFGPGYRGGRPLTLENWETLSKLEYCIANPPIGGRTIHGDTTTLKITAIIRTERDRGAQLVIVNDTMVAKIYDPLYYEEINDFDCKEDVVFNANSDYSREAAAYHELQKSPAALEVTPAFHGTWIMDLEMLFREKGQVRKHTRQIPVLLIEHVQGEVMADIDAFALSEQTRSMVLKRVIDAESIIYSARVDHNDFYPRNIMIHGLPSDVECDTHKEVVIKVIDFNIARIRIHPRSYHPEIQREIEAEYQCWCPKIPSPILRFFRRMSRFSPDGWCSENDEESKLWLWEQYHDDERYIPVVWDPAQPDIGPDYVDFDGDSKNSMDSGLGPDMEVEKNEEVSERKDSGHGKE